MRAEYFDVVIVGAGLAGIGAAYHLQEKCPDKSYVILEGRGAIGGTWDLFRYPGVRSDSDMYTLGYNFKPWRAAEAIANGASILSYLRETAVENQIDQHIRYHHLVQKAIWCSEMATWTIQANHHGQITQLRCNFLLMCSGFYSYESGYTPEFNGRHRFLGRIIHPQKWPKDLDYYGKKVIVIGSGATAVTLIPAMADEVEHIVMLQRSPTYMLSVSTKDDIANCLRKLLPKRLAYRLIRYRNLFVGQGFYQLTRFFPERVKQVLLGMVRAELGSDYDIETHFTPRYNPWDQRLCLVPDSDLFKAIKSGKASVVTDLIDTFTEKGVLLQSGRELEADIIVTATGLNLLLLGGIKFVLDGDPVDFSQTYTYKGMMFSNIPNLVATFGYINTSWTLRADLIAEYTSRLLNQMTKKGIRQCTPILRPEDHNMSARPWIDDFSPNYIKRMMHLFPKQGDREPWLNPQNYFRGRKIALYEALEDGVLSFTN